MLWVLEAGEQSASICGSSSNGQSAGSYSLQGVGSYHMTVAFWGPQLASSKVGCLCTNNAAVVVDINIGSAQDPSLFRFLYILAFCVQYWIEWWLHITSWVGCCPFTQYLTALFPLNLQVSVILVIINKVVELALYRGFFIDFSQINRAVHCYIDSIILTFTCAVYKQPLLIWSLLSQKWSALFLPLTCCAAMWPVFQVKVLNTDLG